MRILVTHGVGQTFQIPATMQREWADALRFGLESAGAPDPIGIDIGFAFYGDIWRPDRQAAQDGERGDDDPAADEERAVASALDESPSDLQAALANELLPVREDEERLDWERLASIVRGLDDAFGVGEVVLTRFLKDLDEYFQNPDIREQTLDALRAACRKTAGPILLMGHSMGSIVAYDLLATDGAAPLGVTDLITFGSPLGMASLRKRVLRLHPETPFPTGLAAWSNVYNIKDFATVVRELADLFPATDGRRISDVSAMGRDPSVTDPGRGHDPIVYLSSLGLAEAALRLLESGGGVVAGNGDSHIVAGNGGGSVVPGNGGAAEVAGTGADDAGPTRGATRGIHFPAPQPTHAEPPSGGGPAAADDDERGGAEPETEPAGLDDAAAAGGEPEAGTHTVERAASADFPPVVAPGSTHDLIFSIAQQAVHARSTGLSLTAPVDQRTLVLRVGVYAADFDVGAIDDPTRTWVDVTVDLDDPKVTAEGRFKLTAHAADARRETPIYLTFYRGNLPVGQLTLLTAIDPVHEARSASISVPFGGAPDPDYVLVVTDRSDNVKGAGPFDISVSKEGQFLNKPLGAFPVTVDAWEYASRRLDGFRQVKDEVEKADRIRAAETLGVELWNDLPESFQRFYWEELHDHPGASIAIYSQEPYIPWELIKPQRAPGDEDGFLGTLFSIARWKQATRFPDPLTVSRFSIIAPVYTAESGSRPLPGAQAEADELVAAFGAVKIASDRATVRALLESEEGVQLIHFAGHGDFDPKNTAAMTIIRLSDAPLVPGDLTRAVLGRASRPFVFLNACEVGEQGWALTRIGGWAEAFTDVGFSGFVGPYWAVNDRVARKAAKLFYHSLSAGLTVGEAIRQIRLQFYADDELAGHPSWLAYTLHCQPNIRVRLTESSVPPIVAPAAPGATR